MTEPFDTVLHLYEEGQILSAWEAGQSAGDLRHWPAPSARILASRLANQLGNERLAGLLQVRTYRAHPLDPEAQYFYVSHIHRRRGALAAWERRTAIGPPSDEEPRARGLYHGQLAVILADLRDFEAAEQHLREAFEAEPGRAWHHIERAYVSEREDRIPEALEAAEQAVALGPSYPPAISATAHYLQVSGRTDDAVTLLAAKAETTQSSSVLAHLIRMLVDLGRMSDAEALLPRYETATPLGDETVRRWIADKQLTFAQHRADYGAALRFAETIDHAYFDAVAENLRTFLGHADGGEPRRRLLDVPFVRQHHMTCAPATLSALSRYWNHPVEHLAVAETICYDGTPMHSERRWAEEQGFVVREFRVDWASTVALIDLGVPFTLVVSEAVYSHLQAVVGYDEPTGTIFIRDPEQQSLITANARALYAAQESVGPRGMAMVPRDRAHLLTDLDLPESHLYDLYHSLLLALDAHDRERAVARLRGMEGHDQTHRLTLTARRALAAYDDDTPTVLDALDHLHERYPQDPALRLARLTALRELSTREYRLLWLDGIVRRGAADAMLLLEYAVELAVDDRATGRAMWYLRRALRRRPDDPATIHALADALWTVGRQEDAVALYRFAACLGETREWYAQRYFRACRWAGRTDAALRFLRARFDLAGPRSSLPARSLFDALEQLDRIDEAFTVLEEAQALRPDDGALLLFAALKHSRYGDAGLAQRLLEAAEGRVRHTEWLAAAAKQARWRGDRAASLERWREITRVEPLNLEAQRAIAILLSESRSRNAALEHLRTACAAYPHHTGLHHLLYEWTDGDPAAERETVLRRLLAIDPADAWTQRELALNLRRQSRLEEALAAADEALALDSRQAAGFTIKGHVLRSLGRDEAATECYRTALHSWADAPGAIHGLLDTCGDTLARRKDVLALVESELLTQPAVGDGFLTYREVARAVLTPDELLASLQEAHRKRRDLWQVWCVLSEHLADMGRMDEALAIARGATQRFPWLPRVWLELSRVHQRRLETEEQISALTRCRELNPDWPESVLALSAALERQGRRDEAVRILEVAIARTPLEASLRSELANLQGRAGDAHRAIATLSEALEVYPDFEPAWEQLGRWSREGGDTRIPIEKARQLAEARPGENAPWLRLAQLQVSAGHLEAALESLDRAISTDPRASDAHDLRAYTLAQLRRYRDAEAACAPPVFGDAPPRTLRGRAAWVDASRGDYTAAIARMARLLDQHPDYEWGWHHLMEWHAQLGHHREAMEAAERLAWLDPANVVAQGWLGDMKRKLKDIAGAKRVFRRAMEFQPQYLFAGFQYFEIQGEERDYAGAERTLDILGMHADREDILAARVRLELARDRRDSALACLRELATTPAFRDAALERAVRAFEDYLAHRPLERLLRRVMRESTWHPAVPALWAGSAARRGRFGGLLRYRYLARLGTPGRRAINQILLAVGRRVEAGAPYRTVWAETRWRWHVRLIRWTCRAWYGDNEYWGNVSYALVTLRQHRSLLRWMRGWRSRDGVESWMLQNLAVALLRKRRDAEALEVLRFVARDLTPVEDVSAYLKTICALGACLDEDWDLAARLLHEAPSDLLPSHGVKLRRFAETALGVLRGPGGTESLGTTVETTSREALDAFVSTAAVRRLVNLVRIRIGRHTGRWRMTFAGWRGAYFPSSGGSAALLALLGYLLIQLVVAILDLIES